ncbi:MAG: cadmium-translocating P-type ATPase [Spirochaetaceae bacterium]|jgi:Cd2+/Zn2+-exporting ATPase|nr:cadmium-translocating P-type ATPase [Spirochaetaceae bacterium]
MTSCCCCNSSKNQNTVVENDGKVKKLRYKLQMCAGVLFFAAGLLVEYDFITIPQNLNAEIIKLILCVIGYLLIGSDVLLRSARNIAHGRVFDENFLMSISTLGAFALGEYPEAVAVMLFYQIGEACEEAAAGKSRASIARLMDIRPESARLLTAEGEKIVPPASVTVGDTLIVRPGERIPLDCTVLNGTSSLDLSALTGEAMPRDVEPGDEILSGAINLTGVLTLKAVKNAGESTVARILRLVEESAEKKSHVENFITTFARWYTPTVVVAALLLATLPPVISGSFEFRPWIYNALVFLVVSCPCALVISIPLSFSCGLGAASRNGILIKGSNYLSALARIDTAVFDKTGTLTRGVFSVTALHPYTPYTKDELLAYAAAAETHSNHPAAKAIIKARDLNTSVPRHAASSSYTEIAGMGVRTEIMGKLVVAGNAKLLARESITFEPCDALGTVVYVGIDGQYAGALVINDEIKEGTVKTVRELRALGVRRIALFTGDTAAQANHLAQKAGIDTVYSELLPHEKAEKLEVLLQEKTGRGAVLFAGDGINDAPSLAISDIGVAMGGVGSDAAIEAADIVLMTDQPEQIVCGINIARKTRRIVTENIVFALGVKAIILVLGALGMAKIWEAVFGDVGVALLAVLNATRALRASVTSRQKKVY